MSPERYSYDTITSRVTLTRPQRGPIRYGEPVQWTTPHGNYTTPAILVSVVPSTTRSTWTKDLFFTTSYNGTYTNITHTEPLPTQTNVQLSQPWPYQLGPHGITFTIPRLAGAVMVRITGEQRTDTVIRSYLDLPALSQKPQLYKEDDAGRHYLNDSANISFERDENGRYIRVFWDRDYTSNASYGYEEPAEPSTQLRSYLPLPNLKEPPSFYRDNGTGRLLINDLPEFDVQFHQNEEGRYDRVTWLHDGANVTYYLVPRTAKQRAPQQDHQLPAELGKPVRWKRQLHGTDRALLPRGARLVAALHTRTGAAEQQLTSYQRNTTTEIILPFPDNYTLLYETPPPEVKEFFPDQHRKRIIVTSPYHYRNITATTSIPETPRGAAKLYWLKNGTRTPLPAHYRDTNGNGRIDRVDWTIPHLSNQSFEIDLTVLTVQSYPLVGGQWVVDFETVGQANLTIEPWNMTTWHDLDFEELKCGDDIVTRTLTGEAVHVPDYECNTTSHHIVTVLTTGRHEQRITFGNESEIAHNLAGRAPAVIILRGAEGDANQTTDQPIYWSIEDREDATAFRHISSPNNTIEVQRDGIYRVSYGIHVSTATTNNRWQGLVHALVDGAESNACYSSGYSRGRNDNNQLVAAGECLLSLNAGQNVSLVIRRVSSIVTQFPTIERETSWFSMQLLNTPEVLILQEAGGGDTYDTTNITLTYDTVIRNDTPFNTSTANGEIIVNKDGLYRLSYGVGVTHNANNRAAALAHLQRKPAGGSYTDIPYGWSHTNQRGTQTARQAALTASTILNLSKGDALRLRIEKASSADPGTLSIVGGRVQLDVEYLGPSGTPDVLRAYDHVGKDRISATAYNQSWDTVESDGDDFSYTPGRGWFTVARTGLYHLSYGVYANRTTRTTTTRTSYSTTLLINDVAQKVCRGYGYNRGDGGSNIYDSKESGSEASCYIELNAGDSVGLRVVRSSSSGNNIWTTHDRVWLTAESLDYGSTPPAVVHPEVNDSTPVRILSTVRVNASVTDWDSGVDTVLIEMTFPDGSHLNLTTRQLGSEYYNDSIILSALGNYSFRFLVNDSAGYTNTTEYARTTNGQVQLEAHDNRSPQLGARQMNESGSVTLNSLVCLNVTDVSDNYALRDVWAEYTNTNGLTINVSMSNATACNGTTSPDTYAVLVNVGSKTGTFTYHAAYANDSSGNIGTASGDQSLTITYAPDTVAPTLIINKPENTTYGTGDIDYDITADERLNDSLVSLDGGPNMTMRNDTVFHWFNLSGDHPSLAEGVHTARFFANDSAANNATKEVNFTVDLSPPVITGMTTNQTAVDLGGSFRLSATIIDTLSPISTVTYTLRAPDGDHNLTPSETAPDTYTTTYTARYRGHYNWSDSYASSTGGTSHRRHDINISVYADTIIDALTLDYATAQLVRNQTIRLHAHLINSSGENLTAQRITFSVNGSTIGSALTNATGWATQEWNITLTTLPKNYTVLAAYAQNDTSCYHASSRTTTANVYARTKITDVAYNDSFPVEGEPVSVTATLRYDNGTVIQGQEILFFYQHLPDGQYHLFGRAPTDANGVATTIIDTTGMPWYDYLTNYTFNGNDTLHIFHSYADRIPAYLYLPFGVLNVTFDQPSDGARVGQHQLFTIQATVRCNANDSQVCRAVNGTARYKNKSLTDWYDSAWYYRIPILATAQDNTPLTEYQLPIRLDTAALIKQHLMQRDCDDLRVVDTENRSYQFTYERLEGQESSCNGNATLLWVQVPRLNASENLTFYLYFGNPDASDARDDCGTFSYTTPQISKYVVNDELAQGTIEVVSFKDGNQISNGTDTLTLDEGATGTMHGNATTAFSSLSPFTGDNSGGSFGITLAPVSYAGTSFVLDNQRGVAVFDFLAPWRKVNITIYESPGAGWTKYDSLLLAAGEHGQVTGVPIGVYRIDANASILLTRSSPTENEDYLVVPPAAEDVWGVASDDVYGVCLNDSTTVIRYSSDNVTSTISCDAGDVFSVVNQGRTGTGPAMRFSANHPIGVHAQADGDGTEAEPFVTLNQLGTTHYASGSYEYLAIAAVTNATNCTRYNAAGTKLTSILTTAEETYPYPSKHLFGAGNAGDHVVCNGEVYAYYELANSYETVLLNERDNRQYHDPPPQTTQQPLQKLYPSIPATGTPFTTPTSTQSCGILAVNDTCTLSWTTNATGQVGQWTIDVLFESNYSLVASNHTPARTVNITDTTPPRILLDEFPPNRSGITRRNLTIFYNVSDASSLKECHLILNGTTNQSTSSPPQHTRLNFTVTGLALSDYTWSINCTDDTLNANENATRTYTVTVIEATTYAGNTTDFSQVDVENITNLVVDTPGAGMINYTNWTNLTGGASLDELITITPTSITVNTSGEPRLNRSATLLFRSLNYQFAPVLLRDNRYCPPSDCQRLSYSGGIASFSVTHFTNYRSAENANLTIYDTTDPEGGGENRAPTENVWFYGNYSNWTSGEPIHGPNVNCTIRFNLSGWTAKENFSYNSQTKLYEYNRSFATNGSYEWNVFCNGTSKGYEELNVTDNVTIIHDYAVTDITLNQSTTVEGDDLTITVNVTNKGPAGGTNVTLNITTWNGSDWTDDAFARHEVNFTGTQDYLENFSWVATIGTHRYCATIDPDQLLTEANETNNNRTTNATISAWGVLYGNASQKIFLGDALNTTLERWIVHTYLGNLFYADSDSSYDPADLKVFTQPNDFNDSDRALGLTGFNDSIRRLFDKNDDGIADVTATFIIMGSPVTVPVINSTNTSAFLTGILWDSADGPAYTGAEDLVFITQLNQTRKGRYGTYNYEVRLPATLGDLVGASPYLTQLQEIV